MVFRIAEEVLLGKNRRRVPVQVVLQLQGMAEECRRRIAVIVFKIEHRSMLPYQGFGALDNLQLLAIDIDLEETIGRRLEGIKGQERRVPDVAGKGQSAPGSGC